MGNPISHSDTVGGKFTPNRFLKNRPSKHFSGTFSRLPVSFQSLAVGVGHDPNSVSLVWCANVGSRYAMPFRIIPDLGQVSENSAKPLSVIPAKQHCDVLHERDCGSSFANNSDQFAP